LLQTVNLDQCHTAEAILPGNDSGVVSRRQSDKTSRFGIFALARQLPVKSSTAVLGSNRKPSTEEFEADQTNTQ
jgi:hypothetical protein